MGKKRKGKGEKARRGPRFEMKPRERPIKRRDAQQQRKTASKVLGWSGNRYAGFKVPFAGWKPEVVSASSLTAESFFEKYVKTRTPVILQGHEGLGTVWKGGNWVENDCERLLGVAGDEIVQVEVREDISHPFGQGRVRKMPFRAVMQSFLRGEETMYMTTQDLPIDEEERPGLCSTPVSQLLAAGDFNMRPPLMGNLLPFNFNLWIGFSRLGSTSGLHHDYHDNLYVLLAGKKQFRLYSPADAQDMYTVGELSRVHANGRINYKGALTHADGASEAAVTSLAASKRLETAVGKKLKKGVIQFSEEDEDSEAIEAALEAVLQAEMGDGGGGFDDRDAGEDSAQEEEKDEEEEQDGLPRVVPPPDNFSRVGSYRKDTSQWPNFSRCVPGDAEITVGQMLYLPAGWFHEVTSLSATPSSSSVTTSAAPKFHMAFNFWFHPPDKSSFESPYSGDFWSSDWAARGLEH